MNKHDEIWLKNFEVYKAYVLHHNQMPKQNQVWADTNIGSWLNNQRNFFRADKMKKARIAQMDTFNILWRANKSAIQDQRQAVELDKLLEQAELENCNAQTPLTAMVGIPKQLLKNAIDNNIKSCEDIIMNSDGINYAVFGRNTDTVTLLAAAAIYSEISLPVLRLLKYIKGSYQELDIVGIDAKVRSALKQLNPREEKIVTLYFGFSTNEPHTLEKCGAFFKVTRERIKQLLNKAIHQMSNAVLNSPKLTGIRGKVFGTLKILSELSNNQVRCKCIKCNRLHTYTKSSVLSEKIQCQSCEKLANGNKQREIKRSPKKQALAKDLTARFTIEQPVYELMSKKLYKCKCKKCGGVMMISIAEMKNHTC